MTCICAFVWCILRIKTMNKKCRVNMDIDTPDLNLFSFVTNASF